MSLVLHSTIIYLIGRTNFFLLVGFKKRLNFIK
nr:MAG TPA: hypothetical protein [Caudoviricetes sp.]